MGAVSPAEEATSVNCARNGIPEGLPLGAGRTTRVEVPCPPRRPGRNRGTEPISPKRLRLVIFTIVLYCKLSQVAAYSEGSLADKPIFSIRLDPFCRPEPNCPNSEELAALGVPRSVQEGLFVHFPLS